MALLQLIPWREADLADRKDDTDSPTYRSGDNGPCDTPGSGTKAVSVVVGRNCVRLVPTSKNGKWTMRTMKSHLVLAAILPLAAASVATSQSPSAGGRFADQTEMADKPAPVAGSTPLVAETTIGAGGRFDGTVQLDRAGAGTWADHAGAAADHVGAAGDMIGFSHADGSGTQTITLVDTKKSWMAVYHIDRSGKIRLVSSRPIDADFSLQLNATSPLPDEIRGIGRARR